jgi:hypothetical protein
MKSHDQIQLKKFLKFRENMATLLELITFVYLEAKIKQFA